MYENDLSCFSNINTYIYNTNIYTWNDTEYTNGNPYNIACIES